jgi:hypothetical protein
MDNFSDDLLSSPVRLCYYDRILASAPNFATAILFTILIASVSQASALYNQSTQTVDVTFDTNLPNSGYTLNYGGYVDSPGGWYVPVLTVDGLQVGFMDVHTGQPKFMGPVKFSWEVGSIHSYSWASSFSANQQWQWSSTSGLASDQSGSITVKPNSLITANYTAIS